VKKLQCLPVAPLQVVGHQQRAARGEERAGQGVEQPLAPLALRQLARLGEAGHVRAQLGPQARQLSPPGRFEPPDAGQDRL
jgi:hypothetical protein